MVNVLHGSVHILIHRHERHGEVTTLEPGPSPESNQVSHSLQTTSDRGVLISQRIDYTCWRPAAPHNALGILIHSSLQDNVSVAVEGAIAAVVIAIVIELPQTPEDDL